MTASPACFFRRSVLHGRAQGHALDLWIPALPNRLRWGGPIMRRIPPKRGLSPEIHQLITTFLTSPARRLFSSAMFLKDTAVLRAFLM